MKGNVPTVALMRKLGFEPDDWQKEVLETKHKRILLNCCRQAGKTTVATVLALAETELDALWQGELQKLLADPKPKGADVIDEQFLILVTCKDEKEQVELLKKFIVDGLQCKAMMA